MMNQQFRTYIDLVDFNERYEFIAPSMSMHNLVIGTPYIDIFETCKVKKEGTNQIAIIKFERRGWFAKDKEIAKLEGELADYTEDHKGNLKKQGKPKFAFSGNWNADIFLQKLEPSKQEPEMVWRKNPYPENCEMMYGMSKFHLQMNYFPSWLHNKVAPTDTRRRPDQRALENGDMKSAADHKDFLENKQRAVRKYKEENNLQHQAVYF